MLIDGPITTQTIDSSGEILDLKGLDISDFLEGKATANFEHNNENPDDVLGWFTYAKKIFSEDDCENERQRMFWEKVKTPFLYGILELLDDSQHPGAVAVAAMLRYFKKKNEPVRIGMSIEGSTLERDGHILKRTVGRKVAITLRPCNKQCMLDVLPQERSDELFKKMESDHIQSFEVDSPILDKSEELEKKIFSYEEVIQSAGKAGNPDIEDAKFGSYHKPGTQYRLLNVPVSKLYTNEKDSEYGKERVKEKKWARTPQEFPYQTMWYEQEPELGPYKNPIKGGDEFFAQSFLREYPKGSTAQPIIVHPDDQGKYMILDGRHRARAAYLRGEKSVRAFVPVNIQQTNKSEFTLIDEIKQDLQTLKKTLTAGMGNAAPSNLTGGSALATEDKQNKKNINVLKSVIRDFQGRSKDDFKKAVKEALPDLSDKYVDHFVDLAEDLSLKKFRKRLF